MGNKPTWQWAFLASSIVMVPLAIVFPVLVNFQWAMQQPESAAAIFSLKPLLSIWSLTLLVTLLVFSLPAAAYLRTSRATLRKLSLLFFAIDIVLFILVTIASYGVMALGMGDDLPMVAGIIFQSLHGPMPLLLSLLYPFLAGIFQYPFIWMVINTLLFALLYLGIGALVWYVYQQPLRNEVQRALSWSFGVIFAVSAIVLITNFVTG